MEKKKLKIVRIFSRLNIGGPSYHVVNLADRLQDYSFETTLIVGKTSPWEGDLISYATSKKINPIFINSFRASISPFYDLVSFFRIFYYITKIKPDIVHTHTFKAGLLGRVAAAISGVPVIVHTYHGHLLNNYWAGWKLGMLKFIEKSLGKITDACIGVSQQVSHDLVQAQVIDRSKMKTVSLGFDFSYLEKEIGAESTIRKKLNIPDDHFVFGTACRLVPIKNISLLIESSIDILQEFTNAHLVIVGQGPEKNALMELARNLSLTNSKNKTIFDRIHFLDWIIPFQREFKDFNYYICCSKNEGTSVSVIEALICQVPVVSTAVGGMPDLLNYGEYGELIAENSRPELTLAIKNKILNLNDDPVRQKDNLRKFSQKISAIYNEENLAKNTFHVYYSILLKKELRRR